MSAKTLIVIAGPTAIGKSSLALKLAKEFGSEIISADSRQLYRKLNIGTAKPSKEELKQVKHHFIDSLDVQEDYSAGQFARDCNKLLEDAFKERDAMILCGGSGLYIDALIKGFDTVSEANLPLREELNALLEKEGIEAIRKKLLNQDPETQAELDNPRRIIRALEILASGQKNTETKGSPSYQVKGIVLEMEREQIYERINARVDQMMEDGLLEEVKSLLSYQKLNALHTVGYKELFSFLNEELSLEEAIAKIKQHSRNYAKRQITWNKRYEEFGRFQAADYAEIIKFLKN